MGGVGYGVDQVPFGIVELFTASDTIPVVGDLLAAIALEGDSLGRMAFCIIEALVGTASSVRRPKAGFLDRDTIVIDLSGTVLEKVAVRIVYRLLHKSAILVISNDIEAPVVVRVAQLNTVLVILLLILAFVKEGLIDQGMHFTVFMEGNTASGL